jgi:hypothetical protein
MSTTAARSQYAAKPDTRLADAVARAERAEAEVARLRTELGDLIRRSVGLRPVARPRAPWRMP